MPKSINKKSGQTPARSKGSSMEEVGYAGPWGKVWSKGKEPLKGLVLGAAIGVAFIGTILWIKGLLHKSKSKTQQKAHKAATQDAIDLDKAKSGNKIEEHHQASQDNMAENNNSTDNAIRREQAMSEIRMNELRLKAEMRQAATKSAQTVPDKKNVSLKEWMNIFHVRHPMPDYSSIPFIASVLDGCPNDYKDAMMMSLIAACGALCFSKVRAKYLDDQNHTPSIQVIVEGVQGSGKGKVLHLYERLFSRVIALDKAKLNRNDVGNVIIQTAGINISQSKFYEVMANNQGVHIYAIESEITTVENTFKKANGLSFEYLRKALYNEAVYSNNKAAGGVCGSFDVYFNYTFTGTPKAVNELINDKEVDGGTASRICFTVIPEVGCIPPFVEYPSDGRLDDMQNQIDAWRQKYCFQTDGGKDVACKEYNIDIDYVCDALQDWLIEQYELYRKDGIECRNNVRMRIASIAFHCAMVLHMLAGEPISSERKPRKTVKDLTIYIADYCMERYLTKFSDYLPQTQLDEVRTEETATSTNTHPERRRLTQEEIDEWYPRRHTFDDDGKEIGLGYIAKQLGVTKSSVKNSFDRYEKKLGQK